MVRATQLLSICVFLMLALVNANQAQAQSTYQLGPFVAIGFGETASLAESDAYGEAWKMLESIQAELPGGHEIIDLVVESGELVGDSYFLEFHVVIQSVLIPKLGGGGSVN